MANDGNWPAVVDNLRKSRNKLTRVSRILGQEGADVVSYKEVVESILHFRLETWVMDPRLL